tara:strand:- start:1124 stop:1435 length:312 start_codon:yes stop_codon:yes gene_type:complete
LQTIKNKIRMAKELNEESTFKISIKTLAGIGFGMATIISMWFMLQADIAEAKELPEPLPPDVTRMEFDMKDKNIRLTIENTQKDVEEIKDDLDRIEDKIDLLK